MKYITLGKSNRKVPQIAVGCMRLCSLERQDVASFVDHCMELGLNFFDHADIYGGGVCEEVFSLAVREIGCDRENMILQSKCGICPGRMYDFSKKYILECVDESLKRLGTEYLDILVLHRPDALVEPEEVAETFEILQRSGKVRAFGVSNHKPMQIELLKKYVKQDILVNQLQFSIPFSNMVANGLEVNMITEHAVDRDGSVLDYCRLKEITIQAWSPFQANVEDGIFLQDNKNFRKLNQEIQDLADKYHSTANGIVTAWMLRHPAKIQMIAGTTNRQRMSEIVDGSDIVLTREEWYRLYLASGHRLP